MNDRFQIVGARPLPEAVPTKAGIPCAASLSPPP